jgi:hypothetical protein
VPAVVQQACGAVWVLCAHHDDNKRRAVDSGGVEALTRALLRPVSVADAAVHVNAAGALRMLCLLDSTSRQRAVLANAVGATVAALASAVASAAAAQHHAGVATALPVRHGVAAAAAVEAAGALLLLLEDTSLTCDGRGVAHVALWHGAAAAVSDAMLAYPLSPRLQEWGCRVLHALCDAGGHGKRAVTDARGRTAVEATIRRHGGVGGDPLTHDAAVLLLQALRASILHVMLTIMCV